MEEKKDIFDHLKHKKSPVPDASYFESLANSVIDSQKKTTIEAPKKSKVIPLYKGLALWIGAAAAVLIAGILIVNFNNTTELESGSLLAFNELSSNEIYDYIDENIEDFDTDLIVEVLNETTVDEMSVADAETTEIPSTETNLTIVDPISFDDIDADDILDYFNDEGINLEDLEDEDSFI